MQPTAPYKGILIALDSVGIDPFGHNHPDSVYHRSTFLFPKGKTGTAIPLVDAPVPGVLIETDVTNGISSGAIECALTYTSLFTGKSAVTQHGLMQGLGLRNQLLESMVDDSNLFSFFSSACLANAIFPAHLKCFGRSYVEDLLPHFTGEAIKNHVEFCGKPIRLTGKSKHGVAQLFTLTEINQNIFVYAARKAGVRLRTYADVRCGEALTSSLTHELEADFDLSLFGQAPLPLRTPEESASILVNLAEQHSFVFYKYQIPDLVSHTGQIESARAVFAIIERFVQGVLEKIDLRNTLVIITSDHGHLEQIAYSHGHPKSKVPTWCFGAQAVSQAERLRTPEAIFHLFAAL